MEPVPSHPQTPTTFLLQCSLPQSPSPHAPPHTQPLFHPHAHSYPLQSPQTPLALSHPQSYQVIAKILPSPQLVAPFEERNMILHLGYSCLLQPLSILSYHSVSLLQ